MIIRFASYFSSADPKRRWRSKGSEKSHCSMKNIKGYEGLYAASKAGKIWSFPKKFARKEFLGKGQWLKGRGVFGYLSVCLAKDGELRQLRVHRLIATTYIPNPGNLPQVNHKNRNRSDNRVSNLEWCTAKENVRHAVTRNGRGKLSMKIANEIRAVYVKGHSKCGAHALARKFKVDPALIRLIIKRKVWN